MKNLFLVFIGGGIGSVVRFLISNFFQKYFKTDTLALGTLAINFLGCIILGFLLHFALKNNSHLKFLLITGFCGGFTTFSAFSSENFTYLKHQQYHLFILNLCLSIILGLLGIIMGMKFSDMTKYL